MRMLMNVGFPTAEFNAALANGTASQSILAIIEEQKPEAVYFTEMDGGRGVVLIVDIDDSSKIPAFAEPWFMTFEATVEFRVVMSPGDLGAAGLEGLGRKWSPADRAA